jgi:hypothetical protein
MLVDQLSRDPRNRILILQGVAMGKVISLSTGPAKLLWTGVRLGSFYSVGSLTRDM